MQLKIEHLSFGYEGALENVFEDLSLSLDTSWRTGLIARNGRGKTTLLRLLAGELQGQGHIACPLTPVLFPYPVEDMTEFTWNVMASAAPMAEDWQLRRELNLMHVEEDVLYRAFDTLSGGEQTKVMLAALFAREDAYPLIDEPTNSLDAQGRPGWQNICVGRMDFCWSAMTVPFWIVPLIMWLASIRQIPMSCRATTPPMKRD